MSLVACRDVSVLLVQFMTLQEQGRVVCIGSAAFLSYGKRQKELREKGLTLNRTIPRVFLGYKVRQVILVFRCIQELFCRTVLQRRREFVVPFGMIAVPRNGIEQRRILPDHKKHIVEFFRTFENCAGMRLIGTLLPGMRPIELRRYSIYAWFMYDSVRVWHRYKV